MTDFNAKIHQIRFRLGLRPRSGAYSAPPDALAGFGGSLRGRGRGRTGEGKGREGKWRGGKGRALELLLNQLGPSEPCYATALFCFTDYFTIVSLKTIDQTNSAFSLDIKETLHELIAESV